MKTWHGTTTGLMIASFIFASAVWMFGVGYWTCQYGPGDFWKVGLSMIIISFPIGIVAVVAMVKFSISINIMTDYGVPVYIAGQYIKKIVNQTTSFAVTTLQGMIEKEMKDQVIKVVKKEKV